MTKTKKIMINAAAFAVIALPLVAFAQIQTIPEPNLDINAVYRKFVEIMNWIFTFAIVLAVILIMWGGISYMTAGGDDTKIGAAKKRVLYGLLGIAIVIAAWGLIYLVSRFLGATSVTKPV
jgi:fumarate reductase subunit D